MHQYPTAKHLRRRRIAASLAGVALVTTAAGIGVGVQKATGWTAEEWARHNSIQEPADYQGRPLAPGATATNPPGAKPNRTVTPAVSGDSGPDSAIAITPTAPQNPAEGGTVAGTFADQPAAEARIPARQIPLKRAPAPNSIERISLDSSGERREALLALPATATPAGQPGKPLPLVLAFPGWKETPESMSRYSGLGRDGAIVVYAEGKKLAWEGAPYADATKPGQDIQFTRDLLDSLSSTYNVDKHRIYAAGMSNGGGFVGKLACELPQEFAGLAAVAGAYYPGEWTGCAPRGEAARDGQVSAFAPGPGVPYLDIHGKKDTTIEYNGGVRHATPYLAAMQYSGALAARSGCFGAPTTTRVTDQVLRVEWPGCRSGVEVTHLAIADAGHAWPGESNAGAGESGVAAKQVLTPHRGAPDNRVSTSVTATREILAFFRQHTR
ncbi:alpha/beta hydrolase family esterase [Corynebacterium heidelbergense]|nr:PHB depolymerase family esterase [Corynebacterium heidelbergense]